MRRYLILAAVVVAGVLMASGLITAGYTTAGELTADVVFWGLVLTLGFAAYRSVRRRRR